MSKQEKTLEEEVGEFQQEQEHIQQIVRSAGGAHSPKLHLLVNIISFFCISVLLTLDILRETIGLHILPPLFSLEISVLLISLKIIWMIHSNMKVTHFQFWILHSIETRLNELLTTQQKLIKEMRKPPPPQAKNNP